jgi:GntR family transcriptional regulator, transcriptional repressor for pyruvate dehydrogenase complex
MTRPGGRTRGGSEQVVVFVRGLIESGALHAGDRLPTERELAARLGVSRPTVRAGLRALASMGVLRSRRGSGTFITDGLPALGAEPLSFLAALHGFTPEELYEVPRIFEVGAAGLAAERARGEHIATLADEVAGMFESLDDPPTFLAHDMRFHRTVGAAAGNPIVASLTEMVSGLYYDFRRHSAVLATPQNLRDAADSHRRIYHAIRSRNAHLARESMNDHLLASQAFHAAESSRLDGVDLVASLDVTKEATLLESLRGTARARRADPGVPV